MWGAMSVGIFVVLHVRIADTDTNTRVLLRGDTFVIFTQAQKNKLQIISHQETTCVICHMRYYTRHLGQHDCSGEDWWAKMEAS